MLIDLDFSLHGVTQNPEHPLCFKYAHIYNLNRYLLKQPHQIIAANMTSPKSAFFFLCASQFQLVPFTLYSLFFKLLYTTISTYSTKNPATDVQFSFCHHIYTYCGAAVQPDDLILLWKTSGWSVIELFTPAYFF